MKSVNKLSVGFATGFLACSLLFGGGVALAASGVMAERSVNTVYVDGQQVQLEAYTINGTNFVKLRDVGKTVGFNVYWDGAVQIDSNAPYTGEAPVTASAAHSTVSIPQSDSLFVLKEGDRVLCDDGSTYEITDMSRYDSNVFADGKLPPLPTPTCDWSLFPTTMLPKVDVRHFSDAAGDDLFVRNLYETRRMEYTIYNALGKEPSAWRNGKPLATVELSTPAEYEAYTAKFWPWRESEITDLVHSRPNSRFYVAAWDFYHDGSFQYTRYCILSL